MLNAVQFGVVDAILICVLVVLLFLSAFFSSSETAFSTANSIRMKNYVEEKRKGARKALYIMEHYDKTLATILVGNNFVNIASTTICAIIFGRLIVNPTLANILNTVIMNKCLIMKWWWCILTIGSGTLWFYLLKVFPLVEPLVALRLASIGQSA